MFILYHKFRNKSTGQYYGRRTTLKGENYTKIHDFNDASANEKNGCEKQKKNPKSQSFQSFSGMVRMTGERDKND